MTKSSKLLLILRIIFCFETFLGIVTSIYVSISGFPIFSIIIAWIQTMSNAAVVYFLFARRRISFRIIKGIFFLLVIVALIGFIQQIYQLIVFASQLKEDLKYFLVENRPFQFLNQQWFTLARCCSLSELENTDHYFRLFQEKFPESCGKIQREEALPCDRLLSREKTLAIVFTVLSLAIRPLILFFLWRYIKNEDKNDSNSVDQSNDINGKATK